MKQAKTSSPKMQRSPISDDQLAAILERISDGIVAFDTQMNYTYVNNQASILLDRKPADLLGKNLWQEYPELTGTSFANAFVRALETQQAATIEDYYAPWNRWLENRLYPSEEGLVVLFTDVTRHKQVDTALYTSEARFQATFEQAAVGIAHVGTDGRWLRVNQRLCDIVGYSHAELLQITFQDITHPDDLDADLAYVRQMLANEIQTYTMEKRYIRKDGVIIWINLTVSLVRDDAGAPGYFISVVEDITERKRTAVALAQSEQKFAVMFEKAPFSASLASPPEGKIEQVNQAFERLFGYPRQEVVGKTSLELGMYPDPTMRTRSAVQVEARGFGRDMEVKLRTKSGEVRDFLVNTDFVEFGGEIRVLTTGQDITERKRAEEYVRYQASLLETVSEAIISTDSNFVIRSWNKGAESLYGWTAEEAIGQPLREIVPTDYPNDARDEVLLHFRTHGKWQGEVIQKYKDGSPRHILSSVVALKDDNNNPVGAIAANRDITEWKHAQERVRDSEKLFSTIFHDSPIGINLFRLSDNCSVNANEAFLELIGYSREELIGHSAADLNLFVDTEARQTWMKRLGLVGKVQGVDAQIRRKSGEIRDALASIELIDVGGERMGLVITADITERQHAERDLAASEAKYRAFFENSMDAILLTSPDGRIHAANPAACEMLMQTEAEIIQSGRTGIVDITDPRLAPLLAERARTGKARGELTMLRKGGTPFPVELSSALFQDSQGSARTSMIVRDITDRKQAEAALQARSDQLRQLTARLTEVEENERRSLSRELHDRVGQTLTALNINLSILQSQLSADSIKKVGSRIEDSIQLVEETVAQVRNVMADLHPPVLADYGLSAALSWYADQFTRRTEIPVRLEEVGEVESRFPLHLESVLFRVAQEALTNVARHAGASRVQIVLETSAAAVRLSIWDNGRGFDPQAQIPRVQSGWGVLTMRERIEAVGGAFELQTAPGAGTKIIAEIPLTR